MPPAATLDSPAAQDDFADIAVPLSPGHLKKEAAARKPVPVVAAPKFTPPQGAMPDIEIKPPAGAAPDTGDDRATLMESAKMGAAAQSASEKVDRHPVLAALDKGYDGLKDHLKSRLWPSDTMQAAPPASLLDRARESVANSIVGRSINVATPGVSRALGLQPTESEASPTYQQDKESMPQLPEWATGTKLTDAAGKLLFPAQASPEVQEQNKRAAEKRAQFEQKHPAAAGVAEHVESFIDSMRSPASLGTLAAVPALKPLMALFSLQAAKGTYDSAHQAYDEFLKGNNKEAAGYATDTVLNAIMTALSGREALKGAFPIDTARPLETPPPIEPVPRELGAPAPIDGGPEAPGGPAAPGTPPGPGPAAPRVAGSSVPYEETGLGGAGGPVEAAPKETPRTYSTGGALQPKVGAGLETDPTAGKGTLVQELEESLLDRVVRHAETEATMRADMESMGISPEDHQAILDNIHQTGVDAFQNGDHKAALEAAHHELLLEKAIAETQGRAAAPEAAPVTPESADVPRGTTAPVPQPAAAEAPPVTPPEAPAETPPPVTAETPAVPAAVPQPGYVGSVAAKVGRGRKKKDTGQVPLPFPEPGAAPPVPAVPPVPTAPVPQTPGNVFTGEAPPAPAPQAVSVHLEFPVTKEDEPKWVAASNNPTIAQQFTRLGIPGFSIEAPHRFGLSEQGNIEAGTGKMRVSAAAEDPEETIAHELSHDIYNRLSPENKQEIDRYIQGRGIESQMDNLEERIVTHFSRVMLGRVQIPEDLRAKFFDSELGERPKGRAVAEPEEPEEEKRPAFTRSWAEVAQSGGNLRSSDDIAGIIKNDGDFPLVVKDTFGARHVMPASAVAQIVKDPIASGYVDQVFMAKKHLAEDSDAKLRGDISTYSAMVAAGRFLEGGGATPSGREMTDAEKVEWAAKVKELQNEQDRRKVPGFKYAPVPLPNTQGQFKITQLTGAKPLVLAAKRAERAQLISRAAEVDMPQPAPAPETPAPEAPAPVAAPVTLKRASDFKETGAYVAQVNGKEVRVVRGGLKNDGWYEDVPGKPQDVVPIADTKAHLIEALERRAAKEREKLVQPPAPASAPAPAQAGPVTVTRVKGPTAVPTWRVGDTDVHIELKGGSWDVRDGSQHVGWGNTMEEAKAVAQKHIAGEEIPQFRMDRQRPNTALRETLPGAKDHFAKLATNHAELQRMQQELIAVDQDTAKIQATYAQLSGSAPLSTIRRMHQEMEQLQQRRTGIRDHLQQLERERTALQDADPHVGEVRLDRDGNPTLYLNKPAMILIGKVAAPGVVDAYPGGIDLTTGEARWLKRNMTTAAATTAHEKAIYPHVVRLIDEAISRSKQAGITVVGKMGEGIQSAIGTKSEELLHRWQRTRSRNGRHETHLPERAFLRLFMALPNAAFDYLRDAGYDHDPTKGGTELYVIEAAAKIMAGKSGKMGIPKEDARKWLTRYIAEVIQEYGPEAVIEINHVRGFAREMQKEVERQYGPAKPTAPAAAPSAEDITADLGGVGASVSGEGRSGDRGVTGEHPGGLGGRGVDEQGQPEGGGASAPQRMDLRRALAERQDEDWLAAGVEEFAKQHGGQLTAATVTPDIRAMEIADAYDAMKHEPDNPRVKASYDALKRDIDEQWDHATERMGITFEPWNEAGQPYPNSAAMVADVRNNRHLYFFRDVAMAADHPMAQVDPKTGLTYNEKMRAIHDLFGHAVRGNQFGQKGEENAWLDHSQIFSPEALPAVTSETKGQNSWVNSGPNMRGPDGKLLQKDDPGWLPATERPYAENKAGLLPERFHYRHDSPVSFVSPNVHDIKNLTEAEQRLGSRTHKLFQDVSNDLATRMGLRSRAYSALGHWQGGSENSVVTHFQPGTDPDAIIYHAATMARVGNQNFWAAFIESPGGKDRLYTFHVHDSEASPDKIASILADNNIKNSTIEKNAEGGHTVWVASKEETLRSDFEKAAEQLGVNDVAEFEGRSEEGGSYDSRETAVAEHTRRIEELERAHPEWRDISQAIGAGRDYRTLESLTRETKQPFRGVTHGSRTANLVEIDPEYWSKGPQGGAEAKRAAAYPEIFQKRSYFQIEGTPGEPFYQRLPHQYKTKFNSENLYDFRADPDKLWTQVPNKELQRGAGSTYFEKLIKDNGYDGFYDSEQGTVAAFTKTPVEAKLKAGEVKLSEETPPTRFSRERRQAAEKPLSIKEAQEQAEELRPKGSSVPIMTAALTPRYPEISTIAGHLERATRDSLRPLLPQDNTRRRNLMINRAVGVARDELKYQLAQENSGANWYKGDIDALLGWMQKLHPELIKPDKNKVFRALAATTSPGQSAAFGNIDIAEQAYGLYKETGRIPLQREDGTSWGTYGNSPLVTLQAVLDHFGGDEAKGMDWLLSKHPRAELEKVKASAGFSKSTVKAALPPNADENNLYGAYVFGPKVGPFFLNLNGISTELTVDRWFMRTWNRWMGTLVGVNGEIQDVPRGKAERAAMVEAVAELEKEFGLETSQVQAALWYYEQGLYTRLGQTGTFGGTYADAGRTIFELRTNPDAEYGGEDDHGRNDALAGGARSGHGADSGQARDQNPEGARGRSTGFLFGEDTSFDPAELGDEERPTRMSLEKRGPMSLEEAKALAAERNPTISKALEELAALKAEAAARNPHNSLSQQPLEASIEARRRSFPASNLSGIEEQENAAIDRARQPGQTQVALKFLEDTLISSFEEWLRDEDAGTNR